MTAQEKDRIECAIRHIKTAVDIDPWAVEIAVKAMKTQLSAEGTTSDLISRQDAIDAVENIDCSDGVGISALKCEAVDDVVTAIKALPSAQPKTGLWIENEKQIHVEKMYHCSECGFNAWGRYEKTKFCGGCGVRMENAYEGSD